MFWWLAVPALYPVRIWWRVWLYGADITVFDNLSAGHRDAVLAGKLVVGDLADTLALHELFCHAAFRCRDAFPRLSRWVSRWRIRPGITRNNVDGR